MVSLNNVRFVDPGNFVIEFLLLIVLLFKQHVKNLRMKRLIESTCKNVFKKCENRKFEVHYLNWHIRGQFFDSLL